jgi:hypothetical protein
MRAGEVAREIFEARRQSREINKRNAIFHIIQQRADAMFSAAFANQSPPTNTRVAPPKS